MSSNRVATPGKGTASQTSTLGAYETAMTTPGKSTRVEQQFATADAGVSSGGRGVCAVQTRADCFLSESSRHELDRQATALIIEAHKSYDNALTELKVAEMIKRTDELPWYLTMLLGACGSALEMAVGAAIRALNTVGAPTAAVQSVGGADGVARIDLKDSSRALDSVAKATASPTSAEVKQAESVFAALAGQQLQAAIRSSVGIAKDNAKGMLTSVTSAESSAANEKTQALSYIDVLRNHTAVVFQGLLLELGTLSDAEAFALRDAFDIRNHFVSTYRAQLSAALQRYKDSNVSKMGRSMAWDGARRVEREVRIAKVMVPGAGVKYAYMDRLFDGWYRAAQETHPGAVERSGAYDSSEHALSLQQEGDWSVEGKPVSRREIPLQPDQMLNYVEPEFLDLALKKQETVWLAEPETFQMTFTANGPQLVKVAGA